ncbi:MAG: AAA family ATPase [bacterium]
MQKLPLGIQTFSEIITENYLYVDKTQYIYSLITSGKVYFLSRPRRFGKSLLISTLEALFRGEKALFKKLWIYDKWDFKEYPVIKLDFLGLDINSPDDLKDYITRNLMRIAEIYKLKINKYTPYTERFYDLIVALAKKNKVVVLIDEYDKPIIDFIKDREKAITHREVLRHFYSVMKKADEFIKFIFLTGVSKFSKTSVFSGLNNLRDLTVESKYAAMLGWTYEELTTYFADFLDELGKKICLEKDDLMKSVEEWYNGYSWDGLHKVYNPFSILSLFIKQEFSNYWFATGTPTFLVDLIRDKEYNLPGLENLIAGNELLDSFDADNMAIEALLFQTGYLTIQEIVRDGLKQYLILNYPNFEVKESLLNHLVASYIDKPVGASDIIFLQMRKDLETRNIQAFFEKLEGIIMGIPYNIIVEKEVYYSSLLYTILALVGIRAEFEVQTAIGRLDAQIEFKNIIYIFEFKYDKSAQEALDQIIRMRYRDKYKGSNKDIILLGVCFNRKAKSIEYIMRQE